MDQTATQRRLAVGVNEASAMAGVGRSTVYNLIASGDLPSFTIGCRRMIRVADLEQFINERASA